MAEIHLTVDVPSRLVDFGSQTAYLSGLDLAPWPCAWSRSGNAWTLRYDQIDSPRLSATVSDGAASGWMLATATLRPRAAPYRLWLELARGTVDRLRNRVAAWEILGFVPSDTLRRQVGDCGLGFCDAIAAASDGRRCDELAIGTIDRAVGTIRAAAREYVEHLRLESVDAPAGSSTLRGTWFVDEPSLATELLGDDSPADLEGVASGLEGLVNTIAIAPDWRSIEGSPDHWNWDRLDRQIEAANRRSWNVVLGPLISFRRDRWPEWLVDSDDPNEIRRGVQRFVGRMMERYSGQVDLALLADRVNLPVDLAWEGPLRLQYVIDAGTTLRRAVDNLPFVVGFTQPFAESQPRGQDYPAFHLADALLRANLDVSGFALDFEFGNGFDQTRPRDLCQLLDRLQHWNSFGLPLVVATSQFAAEDDEEATHPEIAVDDAGAFDPAQWSQPAFGDWIELLDASRLVHAVFWNHPVDGSSTGRGLVDREGNPTANGRIFRRAFRLPAPDDTLPG
jgi:hypothetical protein